jgi:peptidyl-prolyl cis-trans isomerase C
MTRLLRTSLLLAIIALAASSCSTATDAATVNGNPITDATVLGLRTTEVDAVIRGEGFRNDLTTLIVAQAGLDAAEAQFGITGLDTPDARAEWLAQAPPDKAGIVASVESNPELTQSAADVVTTQLMLQEAVVEALADDKDALRGIWDTNRSVLMEVCVRHIVVPTIEEASAAYDRVSGGEDFSSVADEVSLDTASEGGQLACPSSPSSWVPSFGDVVATAPVGVVVPPFQSEIGWHVAIVDDRQEPATFDDFAADPDRWLTDPVLNVAFAAWRDDAVAAADIVVRSQIGRWFPEGDGILPPPASP